MSFSKTWTPTLQTAIASPATTAALSATIFMGLFTCIKAAGWSVDGSSNGGRSTVNSSAGSKTIAFVSGTTWSLTDTTSAAFVADMVGCQITLSGFANGGNNHAFRCTAVISTTVLRFDQGAFTPIAEIAASGASWSVAADAGLDGVDRLTSGTANFVWAAAGNAHWWIVFKAPSAANANGGSAPTPLGTFSIPNIRILFTGGVGAPTTTTQSQYIQRVASAAFTAGSTTADPTSPANVTNLNSNSARNIITSASTANHHYGYTVSSVGDFAFFVSRDGTGYAAAGLAFLSSTLQNETQGDYDCVAIQTFTDSGRGGMTATNLGSGNAGSTFAIFYKDSTAPNACGFIQPFNGSAHVFSLGNFATAGQGSSNVSGNRVDFPMALYSAATGLSSLKGQVTDIAWAPQASGLQGMTDPATVGTVNSMIIGDIWWPMPGLTTGWTF